MFYVECFIKNAPLEIISTHCVLLLLVMGENVWNLLLLHSTSMYMTMCVCFSDCQSVWLLYALQRCFNFKQKFCIYENIDTLSPRVHFLLLVEFNLISTYLFENQRKIINQEWISWLFPWFSCNHLKSNSTMHIFRFKTYVR